jgi:hypothetical protein
MPPDSVDPSRWFTPFHNEFAGLSFLNLMFAGGKATDSLPDIFAMGPEQVGSLENSSHVLARRHI